MQTPEEAVKILNKLKLVTELKGRAVSIIGAEGLLKLAKNGILPHYVLTNPITDEESVYFIPSEVEYWYANNWVRCIEGRNIAPITSLNMFCFNTSEHSPKSKVPLELSAIRELYELPIQAINTPPGVYFLCLNGRVQYIGQAINVRNRVMTHLDEGIKEFDSVFFINCDIHNLTQVESSLIKHFRPPLNKASMGAITGGHRQCLASIIETISTCS